MLKVASPKEGPRRSWLNQQVADCAINNLDLSLLQKIFSNLNIIEMIVITRVCSKWRKTINKSSELLQVMDLSQFPRRMNSLNFMTVLTKSQNLKGLTLHESMSTTDTLS